jgi:hypothetical protein
VAPKSHRGKGVTEKLRNGAMDGGDEGDPETTAREGMSSEGAAVDEGETMASTGDQEGAFQEIVAGTATGLGIDRGEEIGTGGLAADEDRDEVAEGDYWRQLLRSDPFAAPERSAEHLDEEHHRLGWQTGADLDPRDQSREYRNRSPERERSERDEEP